MLTRKLIKKLMTVISMITILLFSIIPFQILKGHLAGCWGKVPSQVSGWDRLAIVPASLSACFRTFLVLSVRAGRDGGTSHFRKKIGWPYPIEFETFYISWLLFFIKRVRGILLFELKTLVIWLNWKILEFPMFHIHSDV